MVKRFIKMTRTFLTECCVNGHSDLYYKDFLRQFLNHLADNAAQTVVLGFVTNYKDTQMNHWFKDQSQKYITTVHWQTRRENLRCGLKNNCNHGLPTDNPQKNTVTSITRSVCTNIRLHINQTEMCSYQTTVIHSPMWQSICRICLQYKNLHFTTSISKIPPLHI
jgi:hypothetical protein